MKPENSPPDLPEKPAAPLGSRSFSLGILVRFLNDWQLLLYNLVIVAATPVLVVSKLLRFFGTPPHRDLSEIYPSRWFSPVYRGCTKNSTDTFSISDNMSRVVFVGLGRGYIRTIEQMSIALQAKHPDVVIIWAFAHPTAVWAVQKSHPEQAVTFLPFDFILPCLGWLHRLRPSVVVLVEKPWYPNLILCAVNWGARVVLTNGRIRARSFRKRASLPWYRIVMQRFTSICVQEEIHRRRLQENLHPEYSQQPGRIRVVGDIKFGLRPRVDSEQMNNLAQWFAAKGDTPMLAAGSTWQVDEEWVLAAFEIVRREIPCVLLLAPRRDSRRNEVLGQIEDRGLKGILRSAAIHSDPLSTPDVFILDTMGELAMAYSFAVSVFIGGTVAKVGHDVVEPLTWGLPVVFGPGNGKATESQRICERAEVGFRVNSPAELAELWRRVLLDDKWREKIKEDSGRLLQEQAVSLEENVRAIGNVLYQ